MIVHFEPFLDEYDIIKNNLYTCLAILGFVYTFKLLYMLDLLYHYSPINTNKGIFVSSLSKTKLTGPFLIKAWIKTYPLMALLMSTTGFLGITSYLIYIVERGPSYCRCYYEDKIDHNMTFDNCLWFSIISYFTVGYGDYYPMTYAGRSVNTIVIIGGMISSAIIIGLVHDAMELTNEEEHVFRFIKTRKKEQRRKLVALQLVTLLLRMNVIKQKELNRGNIKWKTL